MKGGGRLALSSMEVKLLHAGVQFNIAETGMRVINFFCGGILRKGASAGAALLCVAALCFGAELFAQSLRCSQCGAAIKPGTQYLKSGDKIFCSNACFEKYSQARLPKCAVCGKPVQKGFTKDGKAYCSKECLSTTWPKCIVCGRRSAQGALIGGDQSKFVCTDCAAKPRCFVCSMPGDWRTLDDGRRLCDSCGKTAVFDADRAARVYDEVRGVLRSKLRLDSGRRPELKLVGLDELERKSTNLSSGMEFGLFEYAATVETITTTRGTLLGPKKVVETRKEKTEESVTISVLYGLPEAKLSEVLAHELGHDWMQVHYPKIKDNKVKEGWAEYVSWLVNRLYGRQEMNKRIEGNPDQYYGDGFRMVKGVADKEGMEGLKRLFSRSGED